jgi:small nuclear ribonucleoprotein D3
MDSVRGDADYLQLAEDSLNISLKDITVTGRDGRVSQLDQVYIRGSMIRFFIVPDMLQNAPMSVYH